MQTAQAGMTAAAEAPDELGPNTFAFTDFGISLSFSYPPGISEGALAEVLPRMAIQAPVDPEYPEHARVILTGLTADTQSNTSHGIRVFRAADIDAMDPVVLSRLRDALAGRTEDRYDFPRLPFAGRTVDTQAKLLDFGSGTGYRFLLQGSFDASTLRGTSLYYLYQGLTADEKYLLTVILGTDAPFAADLATGQPITSQETWAEYERQLSERMDAALPADFTPSLDVLDSLVQSIHITEP